MRFEFIAFAIVIFFISCKNRNNYTITNEPKKLISNVLTADQLDSLIKQNALSASLHADNLYHLRKIADRLQQKVTVSKRNAPLTDILADLEREKKFRFIFAYQTIANQGYLTFQCKNLPLESALSDLCKKAKNLEWRIYDESSDSSLVIVIRRK